MTTTLTRPPVDRSLRLRIWIFSAIAAAAGVVVAVDLGTLGGTAVAPVALGAATGLVLGVVASRVYRLRWDDAAARVVGRIDALGVVVLVGYLLVVVLRGRLLALWVAAPVVGVAGFAVLAGLMAGQVVGTAGSIGRVTSVRR